MLIKYHRSADAAAGVLPKVLSSLTALVGQFVGQTRHKVLQVRKLQSLPHVVISVAVKRIQVHPQRAREQHRVLTQGERLISGT